MAGEPIAEITVDPGSFSKLMKEIKAFDPALATALRKQYRAAGKDLVDDIKAAVLQPTPKGKDSGGSVIRAGLAKGTKLQILTASKKQGIRIVTSGSKLNGATAAMVKAYNKKSFRHPVPGAGFRDQSGRPYFGSTIERKKQQLADATEAALVEAIQQMNGV